VMEFLALVKFLEIKAGHGVTPFPAVTRGFDPRVHLSKMMDCRVKPGNNEITQYDFGNPKTLSAIKLRISCGETGAIRVTMTSRK